jgi:iron(III) transport system substrate-binding protein
MTGREAAARCHVERVSRAQGASGGPDRSGDLVDRARREGRVLVYTSMPVEDMRAIANAFRKLHGVEIDLWRASSEKVVARVITEARAGRFDVDVLETSGLDREALARERLLIPADSVRHADLREGAMPASRAWAGTRLSIFVQAYNTRLVRRDELPQRWEDLLEPRWKGRLAIEAEDADWFSGIVHSLSEAGGMALFREIVRRNGISLRRGHSLIAQMVAAGEIPFALTVYNYKAEQLKDKGAPIDWFAIPPGIAKVNGVALARSAPRPTAARLFYEYMLGLECQRQLLEREHVPAHRGIDTPLVRLPLRFLDAAEVLDGAEHWRARFREVFVNVR